MFTKSSQSQQKTTQNASPGCSRGTLGRSRAALACSWGALGALLAPLGAHLGRFGLFLALIWRHVAANAGASWGARSGTTTKDSEEPQDYSPAKLAFTQNDKGGLAAVMESGLRSLMQ